MKHSTQEIQTPDGTSLFVERWDPEGDVRCVVLISHGAGEHIGRYGDVAADLEALGAVVLGPDHRGQGKSGGKPGHIDSFDVYGRDLRCVLDSAGDVDETIPRFVFAHSMGALILLQALVEGLLPDSLRGVVLSGPLLRLAMPAPGWKVALGKVAAFVAPGLSLPSDIPPEFICRDEEQVERYRSDARRVGVVSARWFQRMNQAAANVSAKASGLELPLFWYVGTGDKICDHTASEEVFATLPAAQEHDQSFRAFEGYFHELHNEPAELRAPVIGAIRSWIEARLGG